MESRSGVEPAAAVLRTASHSGEIRDMVFLRSRQESNLLPAGSGPPCRPLHHESLRAPGWIRTTVPVGRDLQSRAIDRSATDAWAINRDRTGTFRVTTWRADRYTMTAVPDEGIEPPLSLCRSDALPLRQPGLKVTWYPRQDSNLRRQIRSLE